MNKIKVTAQPLQFDGKIPFEKKEELSRVCGDERGFSSLFKKKGGRTFLPADSIIQVHRPCLFRCKLEVSL
jgi:hypothetical protein